MSDPNNPNFNPGALVDKIDTRDYQWEELGFGAQPFDWSAGYDVETNLGFKFAVKDQGESGSCGGQAWSYMDEALEMASTGTYEPRSAKFIYSQTYVPPAGSWGRDNAEIIRTQGDCIEALNPSGAHPEAFYQRPQDITDIARIDAKKFKILSYANVNVDIDTIAQAIQHNYGVVIGIEGYNNGTWGSNHPQPPVAGQTPWRHWLYCGKARMVDGKKYIGALNSWGTAVGEQGWQWIDENYFKSGHIWQVWTHVFGQPTPPGFQHQFNVDIEYRSSGTEVRALQQALQVDGCFPANVSATQFYGDITRRSVLAFQMKYAVAPQSELVTLNGKRVGSKTRAKLNELFAN